MIRPVILLSVLLLLGLAGDERVRDDRYFTVEGRPTPLGYQVLANAGLVPVSGLPIVYPQPVLEKGRINRCVQFRARVADDGQTERIAVLFAYPDDLLNSAVASSVSTWRFEPPSGKSARSFMQTVVFQADNSPASQAELDAHCRPPKIVRLLRELPDEPLISESPPYPTTLARQRRPGCVHLRFAITPDGLADDYEVVAADPPELAAPVAGALNLWRFPPAATPRQGAVAYQYQLDPAAVPAPDCGLPAAADAAPPAKTPENPS
ncbi:MAG TPA: energy transducer TonB [Nevskiaceae bacterium]|nr:energy transducer TonB [Nevskiaceae bacterium]